jgi:hypothetical protein
MTSSFDEPSHAASGENSPVEHAIDHLPDHVEVDSIDEPHCSAAEPSSENLVDSPDPDATPETSDPDADHTQSVDSGITVPAELLDPGGAADATTPEISENHPDQSEDGASASSGQDAPTITHDLDEGHAQDEFHDPGDSHEHSDSPAAGHDHFAAEAPALTFFERTISDTKAALDHIFGVQDHAQQLVSATQAAYSNHQSNCSGSVAEAALHAFGITQLDMVANQQYAFLSQNWRSITAVEAQAMANGGHFCVAAWRSPDPQKEPGHTAVVTPGTVTIHHGEYYPHVTGGGGAGGRSDGTKTADQVFGSRHVEYFAPR